MPRPASRLTQSEIARALRVARAEGMTVEIRPDGTLRIVPMEESRPQPALAARPVESF
jgi:hypothetical protein